MKIADYYFKWESDCLNKRITNDCIERIGMLSARELDNPENINLISKVNDQSASRIYNILSSIFMFIESVVSFVAAASLLAGFSIIPVLLCTISIVPSFLVSIGIVEESYLLFNRRHEQLRFINHLKLLFLNNNNAKEIKLYGNGSYFKRIINDKYDEFIKEDGELRKKNYKKAIGAQLFDYIFLYGSKIYILSKALKEHLLIGDMSMNLACVEQFAGSLSNLMEIIKEMYDNNLYIDALHELNMIGNNRENETNTGERLQAIDTVDFDNVSFAYDSKSDYKLHNISYRFKKGKKYCIVGNNGSGKSTFLNLLSGLYDPDEGKIYINGNNADIYRKTEVFKLVRMMFQNYVRYPLSIAENIGIGQIDYMDNTERIRHVAEISGSDHFIEQTEKGYNTMLQKEWTDGIDISGGEWQKIAINRTIFGEGDIFIFDEPTSAIDAESEGKFFEWIDKKQDKIIIYIVHKMSLTQYADEILVLKDGFLVENGDTKSLMEKKGVFYEMVQNENRLKEVV